MKLRYDSKAIQLQHNRLELMAAENTTKAVASLLGNGDSALQHAVELGELLDTMVCLPMCLRRGPEEPKCVVYM